VLHNSHQLYGVVSQVLNSFKDILGEFLIRPHTGLLSRDSNMAFVDLDRLGLLRFGMLPNVALSRGRVPETSIINRRDGKILCDSSDPRRYPLDAFAGREDEGYLDFRVVRNGALAVCSGGDRNLPNTIMILGHRMRVSRPVICEVVVVNVMVRVQGDNGILKSPIKEAFTAFGAHSL
jgi:hypothetical protein